MRLEGCNLYVSGAELDRIPELKDDADALAKYLGLSLVTNMGPLLGQKLGTT